MEIIIKSISSIKGLSSFCISLIIIYLTSCKIIETPKYQKAKEMPGRYGFQKANLDTNLKPLTSWRKYYKDPVLVGLIDSALKHSFDMRRVVQRMEIARADVLISRGPLAPTLNAGGSAGFDRFGKYTMNGVGNYDTNLSPDVKGDRQIPVTPTPDYFVGFRSFWEIDLWGKLRNKRDAALKRFAATQEGKNLLTTSLVSQVAITYYDLVASKSELSIIRRNISLQERALQIVDIQKEAGRATELAVQQFKGQLLRTKSLEFGKLQTIVELENKLYLLTGRHRGEINASQDLLDLTYDSTLTTGVPAHLLQRRPDIRMNLLRLKATESELSAGKALFYPSLVISPYLGLNAFRASLLASPASLAFGLAAPIAMPIGNRRAIKGNLIALKADNQVHWLDYQESMTRAYQEVINAQQLITNYSSSLRLTTEEVQTLQSAVNTADQLYRNGFASYLEVITAQRSVLDAELAQIYDKRRQMEGSVDLYRALGGGWE